MLPSDLAIARAATPLPIAEVGARLGVTEPHVEPYGPGVAKIDLATLSTPRERDRPRARYVVVSAITPTPLGEGKTTTVVGLTDGLTRLGHRAVATLRQPSMGPTFGIKGGAAGGGYAQVIPMERLNLHLTGDFHAVTAAHNLLSALADNHLHHGNALGIDPHAISWRRVLDVNDRALRHVIVGLGAAVDGIPRQTGFDITAASEVMALLTLASSLEDLRARLGRIVVGLRHDGSAVTAEDLGAAGAMAVMLREAIKPNLLQSLEGTPVLVHCGPFGNISIGTSSVIADRVGLRHAEIVVTEAGFGADMGAERCFDVKCRQAGIVPDAVVVVVTVRAMKLHSGRHEIRVGRPLPDGLLAESPGDVEAGLPNLEHQLAIVRRFGLTPIVAINAFDGDHASEHAVIAAAAERAGARCAITRHVAEGGAGARELAEVVVDALADAPDFRLLYDDQLPLAAKLECVATEIYGADGIDVSHAAAAGLAQAERLGFGALPVVIAKTHLSISSDPARHGAPRGWRMPVDQARVAAGAGYLYALCGQMRTMPGLAQHPNAERIDLDPSGEIVGLS